MHRWSLTLVLGLAIVSLFCYSQVFAGMSLGAGAGLSGYSAGETSESALIFGGYFEYPLTMVGIRLGVDYWSKTYGEAPVEISWSDITISATGIYHFPLIGSPVTPYLGAGVGFHMFKMEFPTILGDLSTSDSYFGVHGVGGGEFMATPMIGLFAEGRYGTIFSEGESTNVWTVLGGLTYHLPM